MEQVPYLALFLGYTSCTAVEWGTVRVKMYRKLTKPIQRYFLQARSRDVSSAERALLADMGGRCGWHLCSNLEGDTQPTVQQACLACLALE